MYFERIIPEIDYLFGPEHEALRRDVARTIWLAGLVAQCIGQYEARVDDTYVQTVKRTNTARLISLGPEVEITPAAIITAMRVLVEHGVVREVHPVFEQHPRLGHVIALGTAAGLNLAVDGYFGDSDGRSVNASWRAMSALGYSDAMVTVEYQAWRGAFRWIGRVVIGGRRHTASRAIHPESVIAACVRRILVEYEDRTTAQERGAAAMVAMRGTLPARGTSMNNDYDEARRRCEDADREVLRLARVWRDFDLKRGSDRAKGSPRLSALRAALDLSAETKAAMSDILHPEHERCDDCDALVDLHRQGHAHCVCGETWLDDRDMCEAEVVAKVHTKW